MGQRKYKKVCKTCGSPKKDGSPCRRPAGWGTDHNKQGRCIKHSGRPITTGRWSQIKRKSISEAIDHFDSDEDPLDLIPDVKLLRALIKDFIERYEAMRDALLAWHDVNRLRKLLGYCRQLERLNLDEESGLSSSLAREIVGKIAAATAALESARPRQVLDLADAGRLIDQCSKVAQRHHAIKSSGAITMDTFRRVHEQMALIMIKHVGKLDDGSEALKRVEKEWGRVKL